MSGGQGGSGKPGEKDLERKSQERSGSAALVWYLYFTDDSLLLWARSSGMAGLFCYRRDSNSGGPADRGEGARSFPGIA